MEDSTETKSREPATDGTQSARSSFRRHLRLGDPSLMPAALYASCRRGLSKCMVWPLLLLGLFAPLGACSSLEEDLCDARCECKDCGDTGYEACVRGYEDRQRYAAEQGCIDAYDALLNCEQDTGRCREGVFGTSCGHEWDNLTACEYNPWPLHAERYPR